MQHFLTHKDTYTSSVLIKHKRASELSIRERKKRGRGWGGQGLRW